MRGGRFLVKEVIFGMVMVEITVLFVPDLRVGGVY
jgi:hypothetical protein